MLQGRHPGATATLRNLKGLIQAQISRGHIALPLAVRAKIVRQNRPPIPSIFTPVEDLPKGNEKLRSAFKARKSAYVDLIQATDSIAELGLISACYLHKLEAIPDPEIFTRLLKHYATALDKQAGTQMTTNRDSQSTLEPTVILVQLGHKLKRIDEVRELIKNIPPENYWATTQGRRIANLISIYAAGNDQSFIAISSKSIIARLVTMADVKAAASFNKRPLSVLPQILLSILGGEKQYSLSATEILEVIKKSPPADDPLLLDLVGKYMASEAIQVRQRNTLAGSIIQDKELAERFTKIVPTLIEKLLAPAPGQSGRLALQYLQPVANFISQKIAEGKDLEKWQGYSRKLITFYLEPSGGWRLEVALADQLLNIAFASGDDDLLKRVAVKTAKNFTWPFQRIYRLLKAGKRSAASAMMEHCEHRNLFPFYPGIDVPEQIIGAAEEAAAREHNQENTFVAILLAKSILRHEAKEDQRALALLEILKKRWGTVPHISESILQQGNRVLWRNQTGDMAPAVPAMRLWAEKNPLEVVLSSEVPSRGRGDGFREVWRSCLNSGYFKKEVAWLTDLLITTGIRGDLKTHRRLNNTIKDLTISGGSSGSHPPQLTGSYIQLRTWLMIHGDPALQQQATTWQGMHEELTGLGLSPKEIAQTIRGVFQYLNDSNHNKSLSSIQHASLYARYAELKVQAPKAAPLSLAWRIKTWAPAEYGKPEAVFSEINEKLGKSPYREVLAALLFSSGYSKAAARKSTNDPNPPGLDLEVAWATDFQKGATGTWLEGLANRHLETLGKSHSLILYPLSHPKLLEQLKKLPLGLRHKIATYETLDEWFKNHPEELKTALPFCVDTICEAINNAPENPQNYSSSRYFSIGKLARIILPNYHENAEIFRPLYTALKKSANAATARHQEDDAKKVDFMLKPLRSLLLQIETLDDKLSIHENTDLPATARLLAFIDSGDTARALALIKDPTKTFRFDRLPNRHLMSKKGSNPADSVKAKTSAKVLAGIPADMPDRRMFFRILTKPASVMNESRLMSESHGRTESLSTEDLTGLFFDFDNHQFTDQEMEQACLRNLSEIYAVGRHLPKKLRMSKGAIGEKTNPGFVFFPPQFHGWCDLVVYEGNQIELEKILSHLLKQKPSRDPRYRRDGGGIHWAVIRWALEDGLMSGKQTRESTCLTLAQRFLEMTKATKDQGIEIHRQFLMGTLLGYHFSRASDDQILQPLRKEIVSSQAGQLGFFRNNLSIVDQAISAVGKLSPNQPANTKEKIIRELLALHEEAPIALGSPSFYFRSYQANLIPLNAAFKKAQTASSENPEDLRNTIDLASLYAELKEDKKAIELLLPFRSGRTTGNDPFRQAKSHAFYLLHKLKTRNNPSNGQ